MVALVALLVTDGGFLENAVTNTSHQSRLPAESVSRDFGRRGARLTDWTYRQNNEFANDLERSDASLD
jgi:hypothetical protein